MGRIRKLHSYFNIGGIVLPSLVLFDKLSGSRKAETYRQWVLEKSKPEEYPRLLKELFWFYTDEKLNLENPTSFNEKIQWLKIYDVPPLKTRLSDKYLVREWVADIIGPQYLIPLLGTWSSFDEIEFDRLPNTFFLKCNHGCYFNMPVRDKRTFDRTKAKIQFDT